MRRCAALAAAAAASAAGSGQRRAAPFSAASLRGDAASGKREHWVLHLPHHAAAHDAAVQLDAAHTQHLGRGRLMAYTSLDRLDAVFGGSRGLHAARRLRWGEKLHRSFHGAAPARGGAEPGRSRFAESAAANHSDPLPTLVAAVSHPLDADAADLQASLEARGVGVRRTKRSAKRVTFALRNPRDAPYAARLLAQRDEVRWVEPQGTFTNLNNAATVGVQSDQAGRRPLWERGLTGVGEIALVGDTGLDYDNCFFRDDKQDVPLYPKVNRDHRKLISYVPCINADLKVYREDRAHHHGTHVCGSLAGKWDAGTGLRSYIASDKSDLNGLAKDAKIFFTDFSCDEPDLGLPVSMTDYFLPGYEAGARVSHNSWGMDPPPKDYIALDREADEFLYTRQDFLAMFAAGNSGATGILSPAAAKNVVAVGAHSNPHPHAGGRDADAEGMEVLTHATWSSVGPTFDGRLKPELSAPGSYVTSAASNGPGGDMKDAQCEVEAKSGTSMATPFVSAAALLLRQYLKTDCWHPDISSKGGVPGVKDAHNCFLPSGSLLKAMVTHSARPLDGTRRFPEQGDGVREATHASQEELPNNRVGFGRLALQDVTYFAEDYPKGTHMLLVNNASVKEDELYHVCFSVDSAVESRARGVRATFTWMDPAPPEGTKHPMVNNLDMRLRVPDGKGGSTYLKASDPLNNIEQLNAAAVTGKYRLSIFGKDVPSHMPFKDGLPFAAIVTGPGIQEIPCGKEKKCVDGHVDVECDQCSGERICNGHGKCDLKVKDGYLWDSAYEICSCYDDDKLGHFQGSTCEECKEGWYGVDCTHRKPDSEGVLDWVGDELGLSDGPKCDWDSDAGQCKCKKDDDGVVRWGGELCNECAEGYGPTPQWAGKMGLDACSQRSHWCHDHDLVSIDGQAEAEGMLQINGGNHYGNSVSCRWEISIPPGSGIVTDFNGQIETGYDFVRVFRGPHDPAFTGKHAFKLWGETGPGKLEAKETGRVKFKARVTGEKALFILFDADMYDEGGQDALYILWKIASKTLIDSEGAAAGLRIMQPLLPAAERKEVPARVMKISNPDYTPGKGVLLHNPGMYHARGSAGRRGAALGRSGVAAAAAVGVLLLGAAAVLGAWYRWGGRRRAAAPVVAGGEEDDEDLEALRGEDSAGAGGGGAVDI